MTDEFAVQQVLNTYSAMASLGKHEEFAATFTDDGIWEVPGIGARFEGREAILAGARATTEGLDYIVQTNSPAVITVNGDKATALSIIRECGKYKGRQVALEVVGLYDDELVRTGQGWKFARRSLTIRGMHDYAIAPPSVQG